MLNQNILESTVSGLFENMEFPSGPANLYDPLRYMISIGGKRLRPLLCLMTYSLFKDTLDDFILAPASALEVFHNFTLIHDDIMDKSPLRRGKPTVWTRWGDDGAILSGDVMCIDSYRRVSMAPREVLPEVLDLFTLTAMQVCDGQQLDMDFENVPAVGMEDYMKMIGLKTSVLIACAAKMGALIGGASAENSDNLYDFGYNLGLAFQVADDLLDAYGDQKVFGKPIGGDILNKKKSWLTVRACQKAENPSCVHELLEADAVTDEEKAGKIASMKSLYDSLDVPSDARAEIERLTGLALDAASRLEGVASEDIGVLKSFAEKLVERAK